MCCPQRTYRVGPGSPPHVPPTGSPRPARVVRAASKHLSVFYVRYDIEPSHGRLHTCPTLCPGGSWTCSWSGWRSGLTNWTWLTPPPPPHWRASSAASSGQENGEGSGGEGRGGLFAARASGGRCLVSRYNLSGNQRADATVWVIDFQSSSTCTKPK